MRRPIRFRVNGRPVTLETDEDRTLLWVLYALIALPTPFFAIDPQGQVAFLPAMRITPIRPLWQDLWYHSSKALPALVLYGWLASAIARPILAEWQAGRFSLWPLLPLRPRRSKTVVRSTTCGGKDGTQ